MKIKIISYILVFTAIFNLNGFSQSKDIKTNGPASRPNIIVIMADDMGYSDIGCYGSEISTPNLDQLASKGIKMTQFYNSARCCPTRASLLTGLYPHMAGMGWMTGYDMRQPGYKGDLNKECVTFAEVLKPAGYSTYMTGKWHVSMNTKYNGDKSNWPIQRGFDRYFGIVPGAANYFDPAGLTVGNNNIKAGKKFYLTDALADTAAKYISNHASQKANNPFFMYVAFNAPHWPLHAKPEDIKKYEGKYLAGWDNIRKERYNKQQRTGLFDKSVKLNERDADVPAWETIPKEEKEMWAKRMAVYAAQIDCMDQGIGRIIQQLKKDDLFDNTLIVFLSDNGGCAEDIKRDDQSLEALGTKESYQSYRINWANVSNTPFKMYKHWVHEGGISASCIVSWPSKISVGGTVVSTSTNIIDLMPTFLEVSGAKYPPVFKGQKINPLSGKSLVSLFTGNKLADRPIFWEHEANRAVRFEEWKLVSKGKATAPYIGPWELYNMEADRAETINLAVKYPQKVKEMEAMWDKWAKENRVYPLDGRTIPGRKEFKAGNNSEG